MTDAMAVFAPESMGGMMKAADQLARSSLLPRALQGKPGDVLVVLLTGREFGLGPMQALRSIHVVDGKPTMAADLMVGLCLARREVCEYFTLVESNAQKATYKTKRHGAPEVVLSWTMEQAKAANVNGKDNWRKYPDAMLRARCASALARAVYPDLLAGTYDPDELDASPAASESPKPARAPRAEKQPKSEETPAPTLERVPETPKPAEVTTFDKPTGALSPASEAKAQQVAAQLGGKVMPPEDVAAVIVAEAEVVDSGEDFGRLAARAKALPDGTTARRQAAAALKAAAKRLGITPSRQPGEEG